ncbi:type VI secretion system-associated protein [Serratia ureilytica]|uniref:type VI secretion system-associated protein n=1 Tax=Serratia ureilytica TaxID=300181 RepID=UPI001BCEB721|nr:type VI secretion system-associated protein [Serratia ureilytica]EMB2348102.1 type VI secretion system-associated protein [Serratia marcescens]MBS7520633.1 type VI secretion system-associated protein [Serratia ureilytica]
MKYWMPGLAALMAVPTAQAMNYRLVYSPSQKLEVFIDDVKNSNPESWCGKSIPLRIVSAQGKDPAVLNDFLPRVGNLLEKQCPKAGHLPWTLTDKRGEKLATGEAAKARGWKPVVKQETAEQPQTPPPPTIPAAVAVTSAQADTAPPQRFSLPQGCHFRTFWGDEATGGALFIPAGDALRCGEDGWLQGSGAVTLQHGGQTLSPTLWFLQGYPLAKINGGDRALTVVSANAQRLILGGNPQAPGSFLLLTFEPQLHAWAFNGEAIVEMPRVDAADETKITQRVQQAQTAWQPLLSASAPLTFKLVEQLAADRVDPASGSYLSVNGATH